MEIQDLCQTTTATSTTTITTTAAATIITTMNLLGEICVLCHQDCEDLLGRNRKIIEHFSVFLYVFQMLLLVPTKY